MSLNTVVRNNKPNFKPNQNKPQFVSLLTSNYTQIVIARDTNYSEIYSKLTQIAENYFEVPEEYINPPLHECFVKPLTQLPNLTNDMQIIPERLQLLRMALQHVDHSVQNISDSTRTLVSTYGLNENPLVNIRMLNPYEISYNESVFGVKGNKSNNAFYEIICSLSNLRHSAKKSHKMLFMYYSILNDNKTTLTTNEKYVIGAVHYAIFVQRSLLLRGKSQVMSDLAYIWTLDTFYNGFAKHLGISTGYDNKGLTVVPNRHSFPYLHQLRNIDNLSNVNNFVVAKWLETKDPIESLFEESFDLDDDFLKHIYLFPKCETDAFHNSGVTFYNPTDIKFDYHSTKAFIETIEALQQSRNIIDVFTALTKLDGFEQQFISDKPCMVDQSVYTHFDSFGDAVRFTDQIYIPENVDWKNIIFTLLVKNNIEQNRAAYILTTIQITTRNHGNGQ